MEQAYKSENALVLLSGGQDSTTCLYWAIKNFNKVYAISINYNQKHVDELEAAASICTELKIDYKVVDASFLKDLVISNLFTGEDDVNKRHALHDEVPSSFVPYRNQIFLTLAAAWASTIKVKHLVTGVCETDYSGYADCRDVFIKSLQVSLNLATDFKDNNVVIHTPLMWLNKAEIFKLADELGCLDYIIKNTLTCYNGGQTMHDYGRGCDACPACKLRKDGYKEFLRKYR